MLNTTPDALAFRKATNAKPRRPVPRSTRLLGSGVVAESNVKLTVLFWAEVDADQVAT